MRLLLQSTVGTIILHDACATALSCRLNVHTIKSNKRGYISIPFKINRTVFLRYSNLRSTRGSSQVYANGLTLTYARQR